MAKAPKPEEKEEESQQQEEQPKKGGAMKWIIIAAAAVVVLGGGGFGAWWFLLSGPPPAAKDQAKGPNPAAMAGPIVPLTSFVVNLADPGGRRYLKVTLELELDKKETEQELKTRLPEIRDQIILALSSKTFQQVQGVAGKTVLREELTARLNSILKGGKVKNSFFTEFVVQ